MNNLTDTELTMSSLSIAELTGKRHDHVMRDIEKTLNDAEIALPKFGGSYKSQQGKELRAYNLPRRECDLVISGYSVKYRLAIIDRWHELELQPEVPVLVTDQTQATMFFIESMAKTLRLPQSGMLQLYSSAQKQLGLPKVVPDYGIDEGTHTTGSSRPTKCVTDLLNDNNLAISAQEFNLAAIDAGYLLQIMRRSSRGNAKTYKSITELGRDYGKNIVSPVNPRETAPHWFIDTFMDLVGELYLKPFPVRN